MVTDGAYQSMFMTYEDGVVVIDAPPSYAAHIPGAVAEIFADKYRLSVGSQVLELSYHGNAHVPGNIFIYAPKQRTLMVVDLVFPGWMPWRRFAVAQDISAYFQQVKEISQWDFDTLVGGHVARTGTHADVMTQLAFMDDLKAAAERALKATTPGVALNATDS